MLSSMALRAVIAAGFVLTVGLVTSGIIKVGTVLLVSAAPDSVVLRLVARLGKPIAVVSVGFALLPVVVAIVVAPEFTVFGVLRFLTSPGFLGILNLYVPVIGLFCVLLLVEVVKEKFDLDVDLLNR